MAEDFVKLAMRYRVDFTLAGTSDEAELLFTRGIAHVGLIGTKGVLPASDIASLLPKRAREATVVGELIDAGFWEKCPNGYVYRSWDKWQGDLNQVEAKRSKDAKRKREERAAARAQRLGLTEDDL